MTADGGGTGPARMGETHALCASGDCDTVSPWGLWRMMTGAVDVRRDAHDGVQVAIRRGLMHELARRGVGIVKWPDPIAFEGRFDATHPYLVETPVQPFAAGAVLMIEMPTRRAFDYVWRDGFDTAVPPMTRCRAQVRMAVTGADRTVVWVVADNGDVDEVLTVRRDDREIARIREACRIAEARASSGVEPAPDEGDYGAYAESREIGGGDRVLAVDDPVAEAFRAMVEAQRAEREASASMRGHKKRVENLAAPVKKALTEAPRLIMPTGEVVTMERVVNERKASSTVFDKLIVRMDRTVGR